MNENQIINSIRNLFSDTTVSKEITIDRLENILDEINSMLETLND